MSIQCRNSNRDLFQHLLIETFSEQRSTIKWRNELEFKFGAKNSFKIKLRHESTNVERRRTSRASEH